MIRLNVRTVVPEKVCAAWVGKFPEPSHYDAVIDGDADVFGPSGQLLVQLRRGAALPLKDKVIDDLRHMSSYTTNNRGRYSGLEGDDKKIPVRSSVAGFMGPQGGRWPFPRASALVQNEPERWGRMQEFARGVASHFGETNPTAYQKALDLAKQAHPAYVIPSTPWSTLTINNTVAGAYHQDGGDVKGAMGALVVYRGGTFDGFRLVIPEYRFACEFRDGDILYFLPTIWHGNTKPFGMIGEENVDWWRTSVILYLRKDLLGVGDPASVLERAKQRGAIQQDEE